MKTLSAPNIDTRRAARIVEQLLERRPGYTPQWLPRAKSPGDALARIHARFLEAVLQRLNQIPDKNKLAFLDMLGIERIPARPSQAALVFQLSEGAADARLPAGAQVAAPPPPEKQTQIVFEVERDLGLSAARLVQVVSLWPGRDQYIDHSAQLSEGDESRLFERLLLEDTPHALYIAHDTLLSLSAKAQLEVEFELSRPGNLPLDLIWEYWDGKMWRGFKEQHPDCAELGTQKLDGTAGLTRSGTVRLETDCAETEKTTVDGHEHFWIRGRTDQTLPPDPGRTLPEVRQLRLTSVVERGLRLRLHELQEQYLPDFASETPPPDGQIFVDVILTDTDGGPVTEAEVEIDDSIFLNPISNEPGRFRALLPEGSLNRFRLRISMFGEEVSRILDYRPVFASTPNLALSATLQIGGLQPDSAFSDAESLDVSKPFYPLSQQPKPGSTFYVSCQEAFTKPGAELSLHTRTAVTPQSQFTVAATPPPNFLDHQLAWEYWNGREWFPLQTFSGDGSTGSTIPGDFTAGGSVDFVVPDDMAVTKVNDEEGLWLRARLVSGAYGFNQTVTWVDGVNTNTFTYFVPQPPALSDFRISYTWRHGPFHAQRVLTHNDFQYADRSYEAQWPGDFFTPFERVADTTPALYCGFDQALPVDRIGVFFDIAEEALGDPSPALQWEYWNGFKWRPLGVEDGTVNLAHPGIVSFIAAADSQPLKRFGGDELHWLRVRQKQDRPPAQPLIRAIHGNAVQASQWETIREENLGTGSGAANQVVHFRRIPVLEGEHLEVRERSGARAEVEWRILALEILRGGQETIRKLEDLLGREGRQSDIEKGDLRLRRDRDKRVSEVWVRWRPRRHLLDSSAEDRHYVADRASGRVLFGDGEHGRIPPEGAVIQAREYRNGGGVEGNVAAQAISQPLTGVAGLEKVFNPLPAEGGSDAEILENYRFRAPLTLRHRGRGLAAADLETLAREASSAVAVAQAFPNRDRRGNRLPGWATVVVIPRSQETEPWPSFGLREKVRRYIEQRTDANVAALQRIYVTGPEYRPVDVELEAAPSDPARAGEAEAALRRTVENFLHPLTGGPEGRGWTSGRPVFLSDLSAALKRVEGIDYISELALLLDGAPQGEAFPVPAGTFPVAGEISIQLVSRG